MELHLFLGRQKLRIVYCRQPSALAYNSLSVTRTESENLCFVLEAIGIRV